MAKHKMQVDSNKKLKLKKNQSNIKNVKFKKVQRNSSKNTKTVANGKPKKDFGSMSVDDFMDNGLTNSDDSANENETELLTSNSSSSKLQSNKQLKTRKRTDKIKATSEEQEDENMGEMNFDNLSENEMDQEEEEEEENADYENEIKSHKASLEKLKRTDPDFYQFLQENDKKLLDFDVSDSEDDKDDDDDIHKPPDELEIASDESDFEADEDEKDESVTQKVTLKLLKTWQTNLHTDKTNKTITCVIQAFHAALLRVSNKDNETSGYKVEGSGVFNAVIQLCILELSPAIRKFLGIKSGTKTAPHKCKKFVKVKGYLRTYFTDLLKLLGGVTSTNILTVLLKHLHHMSSLFVSFPNIAKPMLRRLIRLWGTGEEVVRVLSFLCIVRIVNNQTTHLMNTVLKSMYMTYIVNSKFVSVNTLSGINFMRRSLVEIFGLDPALTYQHVFLYIRQLAIHLRNAITVHKKENIQAVYNWQFVNSLKLWGGLLAATHDKKELQPLIYPFVQVCLGTIKLVPTTQYFPLRFHVIQIMIEFSKETGVFIPILPFILDVLHSYDFNKKHKKVSMKPLNFTCMLRASNSQMEENGFKDAIVENVYGSLLEYLAAQSHSIAFPDLSVSCIFQIKQFISKCKVANYNKKLKQILDKIYQNNEFIEKERKNITFSLKESDKIEAWEATVKNKRTPMCVFFEEWNKVRTLKKNKEATNSDAIGDYNLPTIKRAKKDLSKAKQSEPLDLFPSDSESETELNFDKSKGTPEKKKSRKKKRKGKKVVESSEAGNGLADDDDAGDDIVQDLNIADW